MIDCKFQTTIDKTKIRLHLPSVLSLTLGFCFCGCSQPLQHQKAFEIRFWFYQLSFRNLQGQQCGFWERAAINNINDWKQGEQRERKFQKLLRKRGVEKKTLFKSLLIGTCSHQRHCRKNCCPTEEVNCSLGSLIGTLCSL